MLAADWLAQLLEHQTAAHAGGRRFKPRPDQHSGSLNRMCCLCNDTYKWLDVQVFLDKDYKP